MINLTLDQVARVFEHENAGANLATLFNSAQKDVFDYKIFIKIEGDDFHSSFPASFAESLVELQKNFYRSVAFALYGKDHVTKLTKENLEEYRLIFEIQSGCTEITSQIVEKLTSLTEKVMKDMGPKLKALFFLGLIGTLCFTAYKYKETDTTQAVRMAEIAADVRKEEEKTKQKLAKEETNRLEAALQKDRGYLPSPDQVLQHFKDTSADSEMQIIKSVKTASGLRVGGNQYSGADIAEINQRASRGAPDALVQEGTYNIVVFNQRDSDILRFVLSDKSGSEVSASMDVTEFDADDMNVIWEALKSRKPINASVIVTKIGDSVKDTRIVKVSQPVSPSQSRKKRM